jgi:chaperonin GroEL
MDSSKLDELIIESDTTDTTLVVNESTELVALRVQDDEETLNTINELQDILLDQTSDLTAKNDAYDQLLDISNTKSLESNLGFNAKNGEFGDLLELGIIDPAKVTRIALESAVSIASMFLLTECVVR